LRRLAGGAAFDWCPRHRKVNLIFFSGLRRCGGRVCCLREAPGGIPGGYQNFWGRHGGPSDRAAIVGITGVGFAASVCGGGDCGLQWFRLRAGGRGSVSSGHLVWRPIRGRHGRMVHHRVLPYASGHPGHLAVAGRTVRGILGSVGRRTVRRGIRGGRRCRSCQ